ncbi:hypothetical protein J41TS12_14360 [Paenibacillus antibioticophila]|uniref:Uncharacterized protein n=1 Tax=Paenibacillus antibioticophila TaxID=1274374 RepID=A0A919XUC9_9BACL|nr:hypothetical protein [Paenibacillus antibioticophila]GIO36575.1 hypothetical protein J41TS12_14360 [Paenibacillus antibioticophila]
MHTEFEMKVLSMIGALKNEVDSLKQEVAQLKEKLENEDPKVETESERMSINDVRDHIKNQLISHYPTLRFTNGNRSLGKLTITNGRSIVERIMIRASKSFREKDGYPSGWFTIHQDQLNQYDLYFLVVRDFKGELHVLAMNQADINDWIRHKSTDSNGNYHFYVNLIQGRWVDDREGEYDCSRFYNNWEVIGEML